MRNLHRFIALAFTLACPIGAGCSGGAVDPSGAGGEVEPSTGDFKQDVAVSVGGGNVFPPDVWTHIYGDVEDQHAAALAVSNDGEIALTGYAEGTINFGNIPWEGTTTDTDVVVAKISSEGQALWSRRFGDSCDQRGGAVALSATGNVLVAGHFCGKMDFGITTVETQGNEVDLFVALFDTFGQDLYSRSFGGADAQIARAAAMDQEGNAILVGSFKEAFDDGSGAVSSAGLNDAFVLKLDPGGNVLWSQRFGGPESDIPRSVAVDATGNILVGGSFGGSVDFGGGPLTAAAGQTAGFLVELDPGGKHLWSRSFGGDSVAVVNAVDFGPTGHVAAAGYFRGAVDFGSGPETSIDADEAFVAVMDSAGKPLWGRTVGGHLNQRATGVAFGGQGDVAISGTSEESINLAELDPVLALPSAFNLIGPGMTYAVRFDAAGTPLAGRALGSPHQMESVGVGFDDKLGITLAGSFQETLSYPAGPIEAGGGWDIFVAHDH